MYSPGLDSWWCLELRTMGACYVLRKAFNTVYNSGLLILNGQIYYFREGFPGTVVVDDCDYSVCSRANWKIVFEYRNEILLFPCTPCILR